MTTKKILKNSLSSIEKNYTSPTSIDHKSTKIKDHTQEHDFDSNYTIVTIFNHWPRFQITTPVVTNSVRIQTKTKSVSFGNVSVYIIDNNNENRVGTWVQDSVRFSRRCEDVKKSISYCFQPEHRLKILHFTVFTIYNNPLEQDMLQPCSRINGIFCLTSFVAKDSCKHLC